MTTRDLRTGSLRVVCRWAERGVLTIRPEVASRLPGKSANQYAIYGFEPNHDAASLFRIVSFEFWLSYEESLKQTTNVESALARGECARNGGGNLDGATDRARGY